MARHITYGHESTEKLESGDRSQEKLKNVQDVRDMKVNITHPLSLLQITMKKKLSIYLIIALLVVIGTLAATTSYLLKYMLEEPTHTYDYRWAKLHQRYPSLTPWLDSLKTTHQLRDTTILLNNHLRAHAFYLRADSACGRTAICVHGYKDNGLGLLYIAHIYNKVMRMNVLLPDLHGHGQSEGNSIQMGWNDRKDIEQWIPVAERMFRDKRHPSQMVLHGVSMGAATIMNVSGDEKIPTYVKAYVEDCGYTSVWDECTDQLKAQFNLPQFPLVPLASALCQVKHGWNFHEASPLEQVKKCHRPMLFIHGDHDTYVPSWMVYPLYKAKPQPKQLWITQGSEHAYSYHDYTKLYESKVKNFVSKYFK